MCLWWVAFFEVVIQGATDWVRTANRIHYHSRWTWVPIITQELHTSFTSLGLTIDLICAEFWCLVVVLVLILCVNYQNRALFFIFIWRGSIKFLTNFWIWGATEIINNGINIRMLWLLRFSIWTSTVLYTPRCGGRVYWLIWFGLLLTRRFDEISI